ncbi:uncharacterized protein LOC135112869 isoform X1 [Scylla paramamosain]|uniref:uncharacterized protein LOC135112869 isoform X1 n=2 Tax=Scylla paramamosain TaxID=85552 RepID=UPI0030836B8B
MDSSDDDDFFSYTPLCRLQAPTRDLKADLKPSKLSLSFRSSQTTNNKSEIKRTPSEIESASSEMKVTPLKTKTTPSKSSKTRKRKGTPIKSRADHPEENCSIAELAQWHFLYGSQSSKIEKPTPQKRRNDSEGESSRDSLASGSQYKKKNGSEECVPHSTNEGQHEQRCLHCRFPFNTDSENSVHSILCSATDLSSLPRCHAGSQCQEEKEEHFLIFNHSEESLDTKLLCNDVNSNTVRDSLVKTNIHHSVSIDSRHDGAAGPSSSWVPSVVAASVDKFPDVVLLSNDEGSSPSDKADSVPLFDLEKNEDHEPSLDKKCVTNENQDHKAPLDKEHVTSEKTSDSRNLWDSVLTPDVDLFEDDQETVCFGERSPRHSPSFAEEERQENQKSPLDCMHGNSSGSERFDLKISETAANALEDPEGDELIASLSEEAINQFAMPALEKVMKWRKNCKEAHTSLPTNENNQTTRFKKTPQNTVVQPICIHLHYHEASPAPSHTRESGQASILNYFSPTKSKEENCPCSERKTVSKQESIALWQKLMSCTQKKSLKPLPSVSQSSFSENSSHLLPKTQERNNSTRQRWGRGGTAQPKTCPFYKFIPDTNFVVDAFSYGSVDGVTAYFLSHFHYDHYCGLQRNFTHPIYCSEITARLVNKRLGVPLQYLNPLTMWKPHVVHGVEVTLLDANHCPGAVMFLFKVKPGVRHLHVGDFRAQPSMERYPALQCPIHSLFLDTTYCSPEHVFPTQEKMIEKCVSLAQDHHLRNAKTLFVVGSYTIGKEKVFKAIASNLNCSIWVRDYKKQVLNCINDKEILARLTQSRTSAMVHVLPMSEVKGPKLKDYLNQLRNTFTEIVGMCPTGWEFTSSSGVDDISSEHPYPDVHIYGIPYSEHSSFSELRRFVQFIKPKKIIPTVNNGNQASRKKMERHFQEWQTKRLLFS